MSTDINSIWAYLHNEMAPDEAVEFEHKLKNNAELNELFQSSKETHEELHALLPNKIGKNLLSEEELESQLLAEWESEHPEFAEPAIVARRNKILWIGIPLATAASILILLNVMLQTSPIDWQKTIYGAAPQLRGEIAINPHYSPAQLQRISKAIKYSVESKVPNDSSKWTLQITLQELLDGVLSIEIQGSSNQRVIRWSKMYDSMDACEQSLPEFGKTIATDLSRQTTQ